jgi:lysophospholipase L1-like esterase
VSPRRIVPPDAAGLLDARPGHFDPRGTVVGRGHGFGASTVRPNTEARLPINLAQAQAMTGYTNLSFWRPDLSDGGNLTDLGNQGQTMVKYGASKVGALFHGFVGITHINAADKYAVLFSDATLSFGTTSFAGAWSGGFASDVAGTQHVMCGRANNGNAGWFFYITDNGDINYFFNDSAGHSIGGVLGAGVCTLGASPIDFVFQVDWSGGGAPILRARWSRNRRNIGSARVVLTGITTVTAASSEYGISGIPGVIGAGQTDGSGCFCRFNLIAKGAQVEGETAALQLSQNLGFEARYGYREVIAIPVGDSITVGVGDESVQGGYRSVLQSAFPRIHMVGSQGTGGWIGMHEGESGDTIAVMSARVLPVIPMQGANTILLLGGTNDISAGRTSGQVLTDLVAFAQALKALPGITNVLVTKLPTRAVGDSNKAPTDAVNAGMVAAFSGAGAGITVCDAFSMLTFVNPVMFADSVHPNALGYSIAGADQGAGLGWAGALNALGL